VAGRVEANGYLTGNSIERTNLTNETRFMMDDVILTVDGSVDRPLQLSFRDLHTLPEQAQIHDVSRFHPTRKGDGVALDVILDRAGVHPSANYVTLHADQDDFHVSVPLALLRGQGIVVYRIGPSRLTAEHGGPIRLLIRDPSLCHTGELDDCANVKYLRRIELSERRGRDTRPTSESDHVALHQAQSQSNRAK
jgi:DMSO/TMAO reductase YedYZ molybdopterin-dependent catalytic subunit